MKTKTNLLAVAVIAAATFAASQSANATVAAGQMAAAAPVANAVMDTTTSSGMVQLAHGKRWHRWHGWHGHWGHGYYGYRPHYGGGCHWLKRKWYRTGKFYWKKRYYRCMGWW